MKIRFPKHAETAPGKLLESVGFKVIGETDSGEETIFTVESPDDDMISCKQLYGPPLKQKNRNRFDLADDGSPLIPGGSQNLSRTDIDEFDAYVKSLREEESLVAAIEIMRVYFDHVTDENLSETASVFSADLENKFPNHAVFDVRLSARMPLMQTLCALLVTLDFRDADAVVRESRKWNSNSFSAASALNAISLSASLFLAPLAGIMSPKLWMLGFSRAQRSIVFALGRTEPGVYPSTIAAPIDALRLMTPRMETLTHSEPIQVSELPKDTSASALEWWVVKMAAIAKLIYSPDAFVNSEGLYLPNIHQQWILNFNQFLLRISTTLRNPSDPDAQITLLLASMDIAHDGLGVVKTVGDGMAPRLVSRRAKMVLESLPVKARDLLGDPLSRAVKAANEVSDGFLGDRSDDAVRNADLVEFWRNRRNSTHGYIHTQKGVRTHNGALPRDVALIPVVHLMYMLVNPQEITSNIESACRTTVNQRPRSGR